MTPVRALAYFCAAVMYLVALVTHWNRRLAYLVWCGYAPSPRRRRHGKHRGRPAPEKPPTYPYRMTLDNRDGKWIPTAGGTHFLLMGAGYWPTVESKATPRPGPVRWPTNEAPAHITDDEAIDRAAGAPW